MNDNQETSLNIRVRLLIYSLLYIEMFTERHGFDPQKHLSNTYIHSVSDADLKLLQLSTDDFTIIK